MPRQKTYAHVGESTLELLADCDKRFTPNRGTTQAIALELLELREALKIAIPWLSKANEAKAFKNCALPKGGEQAERIARKAIAHLE